MKRYLILYLLLPLLLGCGQTSLNRVKALNILDNSESVKSAKASGIALNIKAVTGISRRDDTTSEVEFTWQIAAGQGNRSSADNSSTVPFKLYDDGWRVDEEAFRKDILTKVLANQFASAEAARLDLMTVNSAELGYSIISNKFGNFKELIASKMLPSTFTQSDSTYTRAGYSARLTLQPGGYSLVSSPPSISSISPSLFTDETGVIRQSSSGQANASSEPVKK